MQDRRKTFYVHYYEGIVPPDNATPGVILSVEAQLPNAEDPEDEGRITLSVNVEGARPLQIPMDAGLMLALARQEKRAAEWVLDEPF
jgi:hypothetical protein